MILSSEVVYRVVCECPFPQNGTALQKSLTEYTPSQDGVTVIGYRVVVRARGFHLINDAMIYCGTFVYISPLNINKCSINLSSARSVRIGFSRLRCHIWDELSNRSISDDRFLTKFRELLRTNIFFIPCLF